MATAHTPSGQLGDVSLPPRTWGRILAVMERLAASSDLDEVLGLVIDSMRDCLDAERASVFQYDSAVHELFATRAHGVDRSLRFSAALGLAGEAVKRRAIVNVPDCYADARFNPEVDRLTGFHTRCMLTVPLVSFDGGLEGVAQVLNKRAAGGSEDGTAFRESDEAVARALASQAAVAIRRARLIDAERRKNKIEADLRVAREMQLASLPSVLPSVPGYDLCAANRQAEETGGDTYDIVPVGGDGGAGGDGGGADGVLLLMADASGHGIGPALSAAQIQAMVRMAARLGAPLEETVVHLNALLARALPPGRFVTAFLGTLDPATHTVRYVSAGQAPILLLRADGTVVDRDAGIPPLGVDPVLERPPVQTLSIGPGDTLLLLSDGYYEYLVPGLGAFGVERAVAAARAGLAAARNRPAAAVLDALALSVGAFGHGHPAADDQTAIILHRRIDAGAHAGG